MRRFEEDSQSQSSHQCYIDSAPETNSISQDTLLLPRYKTYHGRSLSTDAAAAAHRLSIEQSTATRRLSVGAEDHNETLRRAAQPVCSSCGDAVAVNSHYFRCPTFIQSGTMDDKITKHGRYL
eukprot:220117_1